VTRESDLDERRELLARLGELQRQLEQETALRREAEAALQRLGGKLDEFVSIASHDVATPLAPVIGFSDLYLKKWRERGDPEVVELLDLVKSETGKSLKMLRSLVCYAQLDYRPRPAQAIDAAVPLTAALAALRFRLKGFELPLWQERLPTVRVPESYLQQVWEILLVNVCVHAGPQKIPVVVGGSRSERSSQVFVRDHGGGVPPQLAGEIFQLFPRGADPGQGKGTGSGLAMLKRIAGFYGGRAWVEATPGGGCTFRVEFSECPLPGEEYAL